ncbi:MAG: antitoxin Xre/MbcA/ParS toxin-binding domain-containing protein [Bacteroidota bacterium]
MKKEKKYKEPVLSASVVNESEVLYLVDTVRQGIAFNYFLSLVNKIPFTLNDWTQILNLSGRTMQRYKKEKGTFDRIHSERIIEITLMYNQGVEAFGSSKKFDAWLESENIALGGKKPKEYLDTTFGIQMIKAEISRIAYGILA